MLGYYIRNNIDTENLIKEIKSIASEPTANYFFNVSEEAALSNIAGTLGDRIFNIEGSTLSDFQRRRGETSESAAAWRDMSHSAVPLRYGEGRRQLQDGDVAGGIQRSLLQPTGTEARPFAPTALGTLSHSLGTDVRAAA